MQSIRAHGTARAALVACSALGLVVSLAQAAPIPLGHRADAHTPFPDADPPSGAAAPSGRAARPDPAAAASWLVRLDGPTLLDQAAAEPPPSPATLEAAREAIAAGQAPVRAAVADLGGAVVDAYQAAFNGLLVHATADQAEVISGLPGVAAVARAPVLRPDVGDVVRTMRGDVVRATLGLDGEGVTVAVVDTGVDYTHAAFGGPGTVEAFEANDENHVEPGTFPTAKVVGGYDFAGWRYSPACPGAGSTTCTRTPEPDGDPLDPLDLGHGTHVAGIAAGERTPLVDAGVAPGADVVALKIFGNPIGAQATTDLAVGALDWVVRHNLGLAVPGSAPAGRIDVVNLSVGADWSTDMVELNRVIDTVVEAGVTVVASIGNGGPFAYIAGSPGSADLALGVAASVPSGENDLRVAAEWSADGRLELLSLDALEGAGDWLPPLTETGAVRSQLAWYGLACNTQEGRPPEPAQDLKRRVALVERGDCSFHEKVTNAERYGAVGVVVFTDGFQKSTMTCQPPSPCGDRPKIPAVMIDRAPGVMLRGLVLLGGAVTLTMGRYEKTWLTDTLWDMSSRGPARFDAAIKPQVTAPGANVASALVGSGTAGQSLSGTSMAAPAAAGVAALLWQRNRADGLGLGAADIGAQIMNTADPVVRLERQDTGRLVEVMRQGAGRADALRAASGRTLVRTEHGLAALAFGHVHATDARMTLTRTLSIRNLADEPQSYSLTTDLVNADEDARSGVTFRIEPSGVTVAPKSAETVVVRAEVRPDDMRSWRVRGAEPVRDEKVLQVHEVDGWVNVQAVDGRGRPVHDGDAVGVPLHMLPRQHACVRSTTRAPAGFTEPREKVPHVWVNPCPAPAAIESFALAGLDTLESDGLDGFPARVDIAEVGVRHGRADIGAQQDVPLVAWLVRFRAPHRIPAEVAVRVLLDLDRDGTYDRAVFNAYAPDVDAQLPAGQWVVAQAPLATGTLDPDLRQVSHTILPQVYDLDSGTAVLLADARALGVDLAAGTARFDFAVMATDGVDDFPLQPGYSGRDYAPDGLRRGEVFAFDQAALACVALVDGAGRVLGRLGDTLTAPAGASAFRAFLRVDCDLNALPATFGILFHYPDNVAEAQTELREVKVGPAVATPTAPPTATATAEPSPTATPVPPTVTTAAPSPSSTATVATALPSAVAESATPTADATATGVTAPPSPTERTPPATPTPERSPTFTPPPSPTPTLRPPSPTIRPPSSTPTPEPTATAAGTVPGALPDLTVRDAEITQAVQQAFGAVPLVAGRTTVVRVNVAVGWGLRDVPGVTARLHGASGGRALPGSPLAPMNPGGAIAARPAPDPLAVDDTLNFLLPAAWTEAGTVSLAVELNPDRSVAETDYANNRGAELAATFAAVPPLEVVLVPVAYQPGGVGPVHLPDLASAEHLGLGLIERIFPLSEVRLALHPALDFKASLAGGAGRRGLLQAVAGLRLREHPDATWVGGGATAGPLYYAVVPSAAGWDDGIAFEGGAVAAGPEDRAESAPRALGWALGLERVACAGAPSAGTDPAYPYPGGTIGRVGFDILRLAPVPPGHFDILAGCSPAWVSDYQFTRLFERLVALIPSGSVAGTPREDAGESRGTPREDVGESRGTPRDDAATLHDTAHESSDDTSHDTAGWLVTGSITGDGRGAALDALQPVGGVAPVAAPGERAGQGRYRVELRDAEGGTAAAFAFEPLPLVAPSGSDGSSGFGFVLPQVDDLARVVLVDDGGAAPREMARLDVAPAGPPLAVEAFALPPSARDPGRRTVFWRVTGGGSANASITLRYSGDDGAGWRVLGAGLRDTRAEIALEQLPGGADGRVEVMAVAGAATAVRQVSLGAVPNHAPDVALLGPAVVRRGAAQPFVLAGAAVDREDGALPDAALSWSIAPGGQTATGRSFELPTGLPRGIHRVTLSARDAAGAVAAAGVTVIVDPPSVRYLPRVVTRR